MTGILCQRWEMFPCSLINEVTAEPDPWCLSAQPLQGHSPFQHWAGCPQWLFSLFFTGLWEGQLKWRGVDDDELVKPHPYPPSFCHSSLPWEGCEVAAAFLFLSGEDSQCRNSWGCTWGNGEKAQRSWKLTQEEMCPCGFLEVTGRGLRMQCIIWFVVLSKSIKPQSYILTIYHILVHLISNGNGK